MCSKEGKKWEDPDFGPTESDEFGTKSLYRDGKVLIFILFIRYLIQQVLHLIQIHNIYHGKDLIIKQYY